MSASSQPDSPLIAPQGSLWKDLVSQKEGSFQGRSVRLGTHSERITKITARRTPVVRFHEVTRVDIAPQHELADATAPFKTLAKPGKLNIKQLLVEIYNTWCYIGRLTDLHVIGKPSTMRIRIQRQAVQTLTDEELAQVFRSLTSAEMDILELSLLRRIRDGQADKLQRNFSEALFDLIALVLIELSRRIAKPLPGDSAQKATTNRQVLVDAITSREFGIRLDTKFLFEGILSHPDKPLNDIFNLAGVVVLPSEKRLFEQRDAIEQNLLKELDGHEGWSVEQSLCDVLVALQNRGAGTRTAKNECGSTLILKPEAVRRSTLFSDNLFHAPTIKIDAARRRAFYWLLDGSGISPEIVTQIRDENSPVHQVFETWFDELEGQRGLSARLLLRHPKGFTLKSESNNDRLDAVLIGAFAYRESAHKKSVPAEQLESLFADLNEFSGTSLALAVLESSEDRPDMSVIPGIGFIQAQLKGDIVPLEDIAEIRVPLRDFPDQASREAGVLRAQAISQATGIRIIFFDDPLLEATGKGLPKRPLVVSDALDMATADPKRFIRNWLEAHPEKLEGIAIERVYLDGPALGVFSANLRHFVIRNTAIEYPTDPERFLECFMEREGGAIVVRKIHVLRMLDELPFETKEVHDAFEKWILSSYQYFSENALQIIFRKSKLFSEHLDWFMNTPEATPLEFILGLSSRLEGLLRLMKPQREASPSREAFYNDMVIPALSRISFGTLGTLAFGRAKRNAKDLRALFDRLHATQYAVCGVSLGAILYTPGYIDEEEEADKISILVDFLSVFMQSLGTFVESLTSKDPDPFEMPGPVPFNLPLEFVPQTPRKILSLLAPTLSKKFEAEYPGFKPFPKAVAPEQLPVTQSARRKFLSQVLDNYRPREETFDKLNHHHGRMHVIRTIIYVSAICGFLREMGIQPDVGTVYCGTACHDVGRNDIVCFFQENSRAQAALKLVKELCGDAALGADWEQAFYDMVYSDTPNGSLESFVIRAADSLDLGRSGEFNTERFLFLHGTQETALVKLREQLLLEADRLQRISDPTCANRRCLEARKRAVIDLTETPDEAVKKLDRLQKRIAHYRAEERAMSNHDLMHEALRPVMELPELFPLLNRYSGDL